MGKIERHLSAYKGGTLGPNILFFMFPVKTHKYFPLTIFVLP